MPGFASFSEMGESMGTVQKRGKGPSQRIAKAGAGSMASFLPQESGLGLPEPLPRLIYKPKEHRRKMLKEKRSFPEQTGPVRLKAWEPPL